MPLNKGLYTALQAAVAKGLPTGLGGKKVIVKNAGVKNGVTYFDCPKINQA
jgi:dynactin complex subunit